MVKIGHKSYFNMTNIFDISYCSKNTSMSPNKRLKALHSNVEYVPYWLTVSLCVYYNQNMGFRNFVG